MKIHPWATLGLALSLACAAWAAGETRYQQLCRKAEGSHGTVRVRAATYFGSADPEELVAAGIMADGSLLVAGNAWGPGFPAAAHAQRIGTDQYVPGSSYLPAPRKKGKNPPLEPEPRLNPDDPNLSGFLIRFSPALNRVLDAVRFGWGNATITHATFTADGAALVSGKCSAAFETWLDNGKRVVHTVPAPERSGGGADLYLARIAPGAKGLDWVVLLPGAERSVAAAERAIDGRPGVRAYLRGKGEVEFAAYDRLWTRDEHGVHELSRHQGGVLLAVDPKDGAVYMGGEESTRAGLKAWRHPFLCRYDRNGQLSWQLWRWSSAQTAHDRKHLQADAGIRGLLLRPDGSLVVHGQSAADNPVFSRQLTDPDTQFAYGGFLDLPPGGGSASVAHLLVLRPDAQRLTAATTWAAYSPDNDQPAPAAIDAAALLPGNTVAVVGSAESALIESPDAWAKALPHGGAGSYLALFSPDLRALRFSSLLPGVRGPLGIAARGDRLVVVGNARTPGARVKSPWPAAGFQPKPAGAQDGIVLLVEAGH